VAHIAADPVDESHGRWQHWRASGAAHVPAQNPQTAICDSVESSLVGAGAFDLNRDLRGMDLRKPLKGFAKSDLRRLV